MILLQTTRYGETSLILHCYTKEEGRKSFILRGAFPAAGRKSSARRSAADLHPLGIYDYVAAGGRGGSMAYLKEITPRHRLYALREDPRKTMMAFFVAELLYRTLLHPVSDEDLYAFLESAILRLDAMEGSCVNYHIWFLYKYAAMLGYPFSGSFAAEFNPFTPAQMELIEKLERLSFDELRRLQMKGEERSAFVDSVLRYLEYHGGTRINLKSPAVLREILG